MFEFLKPAQWLAAGSGSAKKPEPWTLDRNWHRSEAERHLKSRNFSEALRHLAIAVEDADRRNAPSKQRIRLRLELADMQRRTALPVSAMAADGTPNQPDQLRLEAAEGTIRDAIALAARTSDGEEYVNSLDALADVFTDAKRYAELEKAEQEAIRLGASLPHPDPLRMAKRVHRLGVARHKMGHVEEAVPALEKSIRLHEQSYGAESRELASLLLEVGTIYRAQGEHQRAQDCLRRALRIQEKEYGSDSQEAGVVLQQLAGSYEDAGDLDSAAAQYERCLMLKMRKLGVQNLEEVANMQFSPRACISDGETWHGRGS
jgi:tetratricopeptide (TPR) repeat protein